jgi:hypothetical protein
MPIASIGVLPLREAGLKASSCRLKLVASAAANAVF